MPRSPVFVLATAKASASGYVARRVHVLRSAAKGLVKSSTEMVCRIQQQYAGRCNVGGKKNTALDGSHLVRRAACTLGRACRRWMPGATPAVPGARNRFVTRSTSKQQSSIRARGAQ